DRTSSLGNRPRRVRNLPRRRLHRGDRADRARWKADQHAGMELPGPGIPDAVIVPVELEDAAVRAELLSERRGKKCEVFQPQRGEKLRLLEMAMDNARQSFASRRDNEKTREQMLEDLRAKLGLRNTPKRMECYDISNLQGSMVVGSQVTFDEGEPQKNL